MRRTALHWACQEGHLRTVELLVAAGADTQVRPPGPVSSAVGLQSWLISLTAVQPWEVSVLAAWSWKGTIVPQNREYWWVGSQAGSALQICGE